MGAGEDAIIELLSYIQKMPKGSLCIIEEIELGIHPEALAALAEVIQEIAEKKEIHIQVLLLTACQDKPVFFYNASEKKVK